MICHFCSFAVCVVNVSTSSSAKSSLYVVLGQPFSTGDSKKDKIIRRNHYVSFCGTLGNLLENTCIRVCRTCFCSFLGNFDLLFPVMYDASA